MQNNYRVETDYIVVLLLAILIFVIGYIALLQPSIFNEALKNGRASNLLTPKSAKNLKEQLLEYMSREKPYLREDLKINDLADLLGYPSHLLSDVLNNELHLNFFDFINTYRIDTAKALLADPKRSNDKIISIAFDSGFGNKSTFNRVFSKQPVKHHRLQSSKNQGLVLLSHLFFHFRVSFAKMRLLFHTSTLNFSKTIMNHPILCILPLLLKAYSAI